MKKQPQTPETISKHTQSNANRSYIPITGFSSAYPPKPSHYSSQLKSPSPDDHHSNMLTPSKIKYLGDQSRNKGLQRTPYSSEKKFVKIFQTTDNNKMQQCIKQLESQINILTVENRQLVKKLQEANKKSKENAPNREVMIDQRKNQGNVLEGGRRNMLIIQKIKEQYRENLNTLKIMIGEEIKEHSYIIQGVCKMLQSRIDDLQNKLTDAQKIAHMAKVKFILNQQQKLAESYEQSSPRKSTRHINQNTISDILCVSIPQQDWQQSKNSTIVSKLQEQIQKLKRILQETQEAYRFEKRQLQNELISQQKQMQYLRKECSQYKNPKPQENQQKYEEFHNLIKSQLRNLQASINEIADQLLNSKEMLDKALLDLQEKTNQLEISNREIVILRDKVIDLEKHRSMLEQKNIFLENNLKLAEQELKQRKAMLDNALHAQSMLSKQKIMNYHKNLDRFRQDTCNKQKNSLLEITQRIDRLLKLEQSRETQFTRSTFLTKQAMSSIDHKKDKRQILMEE